VSEPGNIIGSELIVPLMSLYYQIQLHLVDNDMRTNRILISAFPQMPKNVYVFACYYVSIYFLVQSLVSLWQPLIYVAVITGLATKTVSVMLLHTCVYNTRGSRLVTVAP